MLSSISVQLGIALGESLALDSRMRGLMNATVLCVGFFNGVCSKGFRDSTDSFEPCLLKPPLLQNPFENPEVWLYFRVFSQAEFHWGFSASAKKRQESALFVSTSLKENRQIPNTQQELLVRPVHLFLFKGPAKAQP